MLVYNIEVNIDLDTRQYHVFVDQVFLMTYGNCFVISRGDKTNIFTECRRTHLINLVCMLKNNGYKVINIEIEEQL